MVHVFFLPTVPFLLEDLVRTFKQDGEIFTLLSYFNAEVSAIMTSATRAVKVVAVLFVTKKKRTSLKRRKERTFLRRGSLP